MYKEIRYEEIEEKKLNGTYIIIDVRSPFEFNHETIPGAVNIPVLNDEERQAVGTAYVQESVDIAKSLGIEYVSKKLPDLFQQILTLSKEYDNLIFFCARGGFRSRSIVALLDAISINSIKLHGGYKAYRKHINENLPKLINNLKFLVLHGNTGVGKTKLLYDLKEKGHDILDLEGCANHRGSILGGVGLGEQHSQKMFESLVYEALKNRKSDIVVTEGESKRIGRIIIPDFIYELIKCGRFIYIEAEMNVRVKFILDDYVHENDEELISSLNCMKKRIGDENIQKLSQLIKNHQFESVIETLMVKYYDPLYEFQKRIYIACFKYDGSEKSIDSVDRFLINYKDKLENNSCNSAIN